MRRLLLFLSCALLLGACARQDERSQIVVQGPAPDTLNVAFATSKGTFVVQVIRAWAPHGADRFNALVQTGFFDENRFFRVVPEFIAQWGLSGEKKLNEQWDKDTIPDDPVVESNGRGTLTYANLGPNTRSHQVFINLADNKQLDKKGFPPIGRVIEGMAVVDSLYGGYSEGVSQHMISTMGNNYLARMFPRLDYIKTATVVKR
jgi:peptidyl-prolyl cis-trans isomerase A (cyclophilin A)